MSEFKIGDVAMVVCSDGKERYATYGIGRHSEHCWIFRDNTRRRVSESEARPLLVIDPEDEAQIQEVIISANRAAGALNLTGTPEQIKNFQQGFRNMVRPPMPEPGLWGVVEARSSSSGASRWKWVHTEYSSKVWRTAGGSIADWSELTDPVLIREGVE